MINRKKYIPFLYAIFFVAGMFLFASCNNKPHYFTGSIEYKYTYESSTLNTDSLAKRKPHRSEFRYDEYNYQSRFAGADTITYYYAGQLGKCISQANRNNVVECEDYQIPTDSIISFKIYHTNEKIMGQNCRVIEWQGKYFYNRFYVSASYRIAPATYNKHLAYNWKFYGEKTGGALILKTEHRFRNYTMKGIAVSINKAGNLFSALTCDKEIFDKTCK